MSSRPAILLDLDGTLVDSLADIAGSVCAVRAGFGLDPLPLETVRGMIGDGAKKLIERAIADAEPPIPVPAALEAFRADYAERCTDQVQLYPGVLDALVRWSEAGIGLAIVTNKPERFAVAIAAKLELDRFCRVIIGGDSTTERKPSPVPLRAALARLGRRGLGEVRVGPTGRVTPIPLTWMIGDGLPDLQSGRAAGLTTVAITYGYGDEAALRTVGADAYWDSFRAAPLPGL